jgi:hypothetical protein
MQTIIDILVPFVVGALFVIISSKLKEKKMRIIENAEKVEGVVFDYESQTTEGYSFANPIIRFVTKDGLWITKAADIGVPKFFLKKGSKVSVLYNRNNPQEFVFKTYFDFTVVYTLLMIVGFALIAISLWLAYNYFVS